MKITETCSGYPSQWDVEFDDGTYGYVRYRWGVLSWGIGKSRDEAIDNSFRNYKEGVGDGNGILKKDEMISILKNILF